jgi:hypothetical protein
MKKDKHLPVITEAAKRAGSIMTAWEKDEANAAKVMREAEGTTVQIVSAQGRTTAHISSPGLRVVLQDVAGQFKWRAR